MTNLADIRQSIRSKMLINGEWCGAQSGKTFAVFDPASGEEIAQVPESDAGDIDRAVRAARAAFESSAWRDMLPAQRERLLLKLADLVEANNLELAQLETLNNGKLLGVSQAIDISASAQWLRYMAGWTTKIEGSTLDLSIRFTPGVKYNASTRRVPVGVVGAIVPWNFPMLMAIWKIAPALACGCTVVLKPAEETPLTALRLAELVQEAGFPPGVLNVVTGDGPVAGAALVNHPGIDKVTFTGSTEVGRIIGQQCGQAIRRASLELGGKSPVLVLEDCDPELAVQGAAAAIFLNQGQVCTAGSRLYVHKKNYDRVVSGLASVAENTVLGSGFDPATQMGPLVSARQRERVMGYIESGRSEGAEIVSGGVAPNRPGYFVKPTVVSNTACKSLTVVREEIFGPVVVAMPFDDIDSVLREANNSQYGLGASIWTNNLSAANKLIDRIDAGTVWVNTHNVVDPSMPFGGFKSSGVGREHGRAALDAYTEIKSVCIAY
ncbi:phenylacetaldehyde dehydrogenase StyD [Noviherbaspirillum sp.]|uniref:phenylacetaldehyde dehydrogenase StyD n=1 Tax=Noviherbaspirillum sp. TaxID=1926288 RepID=UPI002B479AC1|nr:aldehyde dehydrogenase family protein [Noviherbaspirillum sp.]HJV80047.1 aldehyde dehydrogenase family protein [Noviherbaspirillum sp.]